MKFGEIEEGSRSDLDYVPLVEKNKPVKPEQIIVLSDHTRSARYAKKYSSSKTLIKSSKRLTPSRVPTEMSLYLSNDINVRPAYRKRKQPPDRHFCTRCLYLFTLIVVFFLLITFWPLIASCLSDLFPSSSHYRPACNVSDPFCGSYADTSIPPSPVMHKHNLNPVQQPVLALPASSVRVQRIDRFTLGKWGGPFLGVLFSGNCDKTHQLTKVGCH
eukprot:g15597.t1